MLVCHFPDCLFKTRYKFNLSRHFRTHKIYGNFSYTCVHCEAKFFTAATLGKHKRICKKVSISAAPSSQKNYSLNVHIPSKNTNPKDPSSTSCETDTLRGTDIVAPPLNSDASATSSGQGQPQRLAASNSNNEKVCCDHDEGASCISKEAHHGSVESNSRNSCRGNKYKCSDCDFTAPSSWHLTRHRAVHGDGFRYSCSFPKCWYKTNQMESLKDHQERRHAGISPDIGTDTAAFGSTEDTEMGPEESETVAETIPVVSEEPNIASVELCCDFFFESLDLTYACMLCPFVGNSLQAAWVHAAMHNPTV